MRSLLYPAPGIPIPDPPPAPLESVDLTTPDGTTISAWLHPPGPRVPDDAPAILFFHGNGENLEAVRRGGTFEALAGIGGPVMAIDYPGYGRSGGTPAEEGLIAAGQAGFAKLLELAGDRPAAMFGWSIGAAVAIQVAADRPEDVDRLVLASPWTTLEEVAGSHFPGFLVRMVLSEKYDSVEAAAKVRCPTLVIHGARDVTIPTALGKRLAEELGDRATWREVEGTGHNDLLARSETWEAVGAFLNG